MMPNTTRSSAGYVVYNSSNGVPTGGLAAEMLERQRLHQKYERYVHEEDIADQKQKSHQAKAQIRATVTQLVKDEEPVHYYSTDDTHSAVGRGVAEPYEVQIETYGSTISQDMAAIRVQREDRIHKFDDDKQTLRDTMYSRSPFAAELQGPGVHSGDPLGMTPARMMQKPRNTDGEAEMKMMEARMVAEETKARLYEDRRPHYQMRPFNEVMNPLTGARTPALTSAAQSAHLAQVDHVQRTRMASQSAMMTRANERMYKGGVNVSKPSFHVKAALVN